MLLNRFDEIVSLGRACQPAYQIRRIFGAERAHVFDWVITPDQGLRASIDAGLDQFFERDRLVVGASQCVVDRITDVRFLHEFPSKSVSDAEFTENVGRYALLIDRWRELMASNQRVLFVRQHAWEEDARVSALMLRETLDRAGPSLDYEILYLTEEDEPAWNEARIVNHRLHQPEPYDWRGDNAAWSALFDSVAAAPARA